MRCLKRRKIQAKQNQLLTLLKSIQMKKLKLNKQTIAQLDNSDKIYGGTDPRAETRVVQSDFKSLCLSCASACIMCVQCDPTLPPAH